VFETPDLNYISIPISYTRFDKSPRN